MKVTRQSLANEAASHWHATYDSGEYGADKLVIGRALDALGPTPDPDAVDRVIGNSCWTHYWQCSGCEKLDPDVVVQVGQEPDYESSTAFLCLDCLREAARVGGVL